MGPGQLVLTVYGWGTLATFLLLALFTRHEDVGSDSEYDFEVHTFASGALACLLVALAWPAIVFVLALIVAVVVVFTVLDYVDRIRGP